MVQKKMAELGVELYDQDLEDRVIRIVAKIKKARNRPCYQNILTKLKTGGRPIEMDDLKVFINNMVANGLLTQKFIVRDEQELESFSLVDDEKSFLDDGEYDTLLKEGEESFVTSDAYINNMMCELISNKIKDEVRQQLDRNKLNNFNTPVAVECPNEQLIHSHIKVSSKEVNECDKNDDKASNKCNNSSTRNDELIKAPGGVLHFVG